MKLTSRLLGYLNRVFDKDPKPFQAIQFSSGTSATWSVDDGVFSIGVEPYAAGETAPAPVSISSLEMDFTKPVTGGAPLTIRVNFGGVTPWVHGRCYEVSVVVNKVGATTARVAVFASAMGADGRLSEAVHWVEIPAGAKAIKVRFGLGVLPEAPSGIAVFNVARVSGAESIAFGLAYDDIYTGSMTVDSAAISDITPYSAEFALSSLTLGQLADRISTIPWCKASVVDLERGGLLASVLLDANGQSVTGGASYMAGYTSLLWAFIEGWAVELTDLRRQIAGAPDQLDLNKGSGVWLDEIGGYYGVTRSLNETDEVYGPRVIAEALRPRSNNVALEAAIKVYTGQDATVTDVVEYGDAFPLHDGAIDYDGTQVHDSGVAALYGLFDVEYGFDLENGTDITAFQSELRKLIGRLRAAGTHLRALALQSSALADTVARSTDALTATAYLAASDDVAAPSDAMSMSGALALGGDTVASPTDTSVLQIPLTSIRNGRVLRNGFRIHSQFATLTQNLEGTVSTITPA